MVELTNATKLRVRELGWSEELIARVEATPLRDRTVANMALLNIAPDRAERFVGLVEKNPQQMANVTLNFIRTKSEKGVRAKPGPHGLGTPEINIGTYGIVPDRWPFENDTPLGSNPDANAYLPGNYHIYEKAEVWAEGVDHLYEDAIRERWIPASDLPWKDGLKDLPEEMERAICQLATVYSANGLAEQKIIAKWLEPIAYGFHDVMLFLGTQIYDAGHKVEALRKRALVNGGGLGQAPLGTLYRGWYGALKLTEMLIAVDVVYKSFEVTLFEAYQDFAQCDLDARLFELMARDSRRHLEYGKRHLFWYLQHKPESRSFVPLWITRAENALNAELRFSYTEPESLILLMGGGMERLSAGVDKLRSLRQKQVKDYIRVLDEVGIDHLPNIHPGLLKLGEDPIGNYSGPGRQL
jgi:hypothetical protein